MTERELRRKGFGAVQKFSGYYCLWIYATGTANCVQYSSQLFVVKFTERPIRPATLVQQGKVQDDVTVKVTLKVAFMNNTLFKNSYRKYGASGA